MTDSELVAAVRDGAREAYGTLMERYRARVFALCVRLAGNVPDAEDLAHQAFVDGYVKLDQLRDAAKFGPWVSAIALNLGRAWLRDRRQAPLPLSEADEEAAATAAGAAPAAGLSGGLMRLSADQRIAVVLHHLDGLAYRDVASFLDVPIGTVMSRLHRARGAMRQYLQEMDTMDTPPIEDPAAFRREVDAEIDLIIEMSDNRAALTDRLDMVLQRSPERFVTLLRPDGSDTLRERLASVLPRLGRPALALMLGAWKSPDLREGVEDVLRRYIAQSSCRYVHMPARTLYQLIDVLDTSPLTPGERAELLIALLRDCRDAEAAALLACALLRDANEALPRLFAYADACATPSELHAAPQLVYALCRVGSRVLERIEPRFLAGNETLVDLALVESVARCIDHPWLLDAPPLHKADALRVRAIWTPKWPELWRSDFPAGLLDRITGYLVARLDAPGAPVRAAALRCLRHLRARETAAAVRSCLDSADAQTRAEATLTLGEFEDVASLPVIMALAESGEPGERRAAISTLGRLGHADAHAVLARAIDDADSAVATAAVSALVDLQTDDSRATVAKVLRSGPLPLKKAAARLMEAAPPRRTSTTFEEERLRRSFGDVTPMHRFSLDAVMRWALPELRAYDHAEITRRIASVCSDYAGTRRFLITDGLLERESGVYTFTALGETVWRVEQSILDHYLGGVIRRKAVEA